VAAPRVWALLQRELGWGQGQLRESPRRMRSGWGGDIAGGLLSSRRPPSAWRWLVDQLQRAAGARSGDASILVAAAPVADASGPALGAMAAHICPYAEAFGGALGPAAAIRAEAGGAVPLLLEAHRPLVAPLAWPALAAGEPAPPLPLKLHGRYSRGRRCSPACSGFIETRPSPLSRPRDVFS